jgi:MerR family mercuric resistance operon transcriptional regulator
MAASTPAKSELLNFSNGIACVNRFDAWQSRVRTMVRSQEVAPGAVAMSDLTIGRLAAEAGVNVETIRYYQRRALLPQPAKPGQGHRRYAAEAVRRVRFIKRAQALGFTLEEIGSLLALDEARACADTREMAAHKLQIIDTKLAGLKAMRRALTVLLRQCDAGAPEGHCPIIAALATD